MAHNIEDRGKTLRLFDYASEAFKAHPCATQIQWKSGWLVLRADGRWVDAYGVLPSDWRPTDEHK